MKTQSLSIKNNIKRLFLLVMLVSLVACASFDLESPSNVDLNGHWVLDSAVSHVVIFPLAHSAKQGPKGDGRGDGPRGGGDRGGPGKRGGEGSNNENGRQRFQKPESATATEMTIELVSDSMGVLYKSGNYRDVDWGVKEIRNRTISAGWKGDLLIIKTKGGTGTITETYQLSENSTVLTVQFTVDGNQYNRIYRRQ